jgi:hypothetical protein
MFARDYVERASRALRVCVLGGVDGQLIDHKTKLLCILAGQAQDVGLHSAMQAGGGCYKASQVFKERLEGDSSRFAVRRKEAVQLPYGAQATSDFCQRRASDRIGHAYLFEQKEVGGYLQAVGDPMVKFTTHECLSLPSVPTRSAQPKQVRLCRFCHNASQ